MTLKDLWRASDVPLTLRSSETSPFGRKVRMAAISLGLADRMIVQTADTSDPLDSLRIQNPLGKMPCLLIGDEAIFDSAVILELLNEADGTHRLIPQGGMARFRALTQAKLADGVTDAALLMIYDQRFRETPSPRWLDHQAQKIARALAALEANPPAVQADIAGITLACALSYLDWRAPVQWRAAHPRLEVWLAQFEAEVPAYSLTQRRS